MSVNVSSVSADQRLLLELLKRAVQQGATDLHVAGNAPPVLRIRGELVPQSALGVITPEISQRMLFSILSEYQQEEFITEKEIDLAYEAPGIGRFRVNIFFDRNAIGAAFRRIPDEPISIGKLGLPSIITKLCDKDNGLILITGATGSGKTTTLAGCIDYINTHFNKHIITIEDPIEYIHKNKKSLIRQREVGLHTNSFNSALRVSLRQDPDVILVGEMRDMDSVKVTLTAAETGHLVFSTLHTNGAVETIARIVDIFPGENQGQIRVQLSATLEGVLSQTLIPMPNGKGMALACEILVATPAVRNVIRDGRMHTMKGLMEIGTEAGMQTMEYSLKELYLRGKITYEDAEARVSDIEGFKKLIGALPSDNVTGAEGI